MTEHDRPEKIPSAAIAGMVMLAVMSVIFTGFARFTGIGAVEAPQSPVVESRTLRVRDGQNGSVIVQDAKSDNVITVVAPGENGFLRGVFRSLVRTRQLHNLPHHDATFALARLADGRLTLSDPETESRIDLIAFGPTNVETFAVLLKPGSLEQ